KRQKQQVYVDAMQNARGKTIAAAFSARAKPGASVSMPLSWKQIEKGVKISDFTIKNVPGLIKKNRDAWEKFFDTRQKLSFQAKLKLPRIERRGGAAEITAVAGPLMEGVDVVDEWRSGGFVEAIE